MLEKMLENKGVQMMLANLLKQAAPEMMEQVRKLPDYKDCPAIYLTARAGPENQKLLSDPNDLAIIVKPFDPMTLADEIREIWKAKYSA